MQTHDLYQNEDVNPLRNNPPTTGLSPYLAVGSLSPRYVLHRLQQLEETVHSSATYLLRQLLRREFCHALGAHGRLQPQRNIPWKVGQSAEKLLEKWQQGQTGYPFIDAGIVQLWKHGWLHQAWRAALSAFLTRGDLFIDWQRGANFFARHAVDYDWACNRYWWLRTSCSSFDDDFRMVPNPITLGERYDYHGLHVKQWLPALSRIDENYLWDPSSAPRSVQVHAKCIVGFDYPARIVDHHAAAKSNYSILRRCYR